jgi:hypothetical protein
MTASGRTAAREAALSRLHDALAGMELPEARKTTTVDFDLRWLGRNMAIRNHAHPRFQDAVEALRELGVQFILAH